jgi:hypothetical protein
LLAFILQDDPKLLTVKSAICGKVTQHQLDGQRAVQEFPAVMNRNWYPALDAARAETILVQRESP